MSNFSSQCQYIVEKRRNEKKISISQRISFDGTLNSQREDYDKCMSYSEEK